MHKICLIGGTGFVGKHLANQLAAKGWRVKVLTRRREEHRELLVLPSLQLISANVYDQEQLNAQVADCDVVINLVGILNEKGKDGAGFRKAHVELSQKVVAACKANHIKRLLHMSALHADEKNGKSFYLRTKGEAENFVHAHSELHVTSFRPSVIFGEDDSFFNRFAQLLRLAPFFPLACPDAKFAPVWVNDVVEAFIKALDNPQHYDKRYNLCGPTVYTLHQLVEYTAQLIDKKRWIIPLNDKMAQLQAKIMEHVPGKPFSMDNYLSLQTDSICSTNDFALLGITPNTVEAIMSKYFYSSTPRTLYAGFRHQARRD